MSCTTLLVKRGGIQRLMEVNYNQYTSVVGRIRIAVEDVSSCFFFVTHVLVPVSSDSAAQLMWRA